MVNDWREDVIHQFLQGMGINVGQCVQNGHVALAFDDNDILHIEYGESDRLSLSICHSVDMSDEENVLERALTFNHYVKHRPLRPVAYYLKGQLVLKTILDKDNIHLMGLDQSLVNLRQVREKLTA